MSSATRDGILAPQMNVSPSELQLNWTDVMDWDVHAKAII